MNRPPRSKRPPARPSVSLARALSKLGFCSRTQAHALIAAGRVKANGNPALDAERRVDLTRDRLEVDGRRVDAPTRLYLMLNKPRGLVTTAVDEQGRGTVYDCLAPLDLPWVAPVGRLDKASEGLLLFTNDTCWADRVLNPASHLEKIYHVQIDCLPDDTLLRRLQSGTTTAEGEHLAARRVKLLRAGGKNSWLEIGLEEGRNRHIRRLLEAHQITVLRLVRVAIGPLLLGQLPKGQVRGLARSELSALHAAMSPTPPSR